MNPLTRSPGPRQPSLLVSERRLKATSSAPEASDEGESGIRQVQFTWILPDAVLGVRPPPPDGVSDWLADLRQEGVTVVASLNADLPVARAVLARHHMHAIACPLRQPEGLTVETAFSLCGGLLRLLRQGERIALHCDESLETTALVSGALLLWMGRPVAEALAVPMRLGAPGGVSERHQQFQMEFSAALAQRDLIGPSWNRRHAL